MATPQYFSRALLAINLLVYSNGFAGYRDAAKKSPNGRFVAVGSEIGIRVTDTIRNKTIVKYGHPLGFTTPEIWTNDSTLIFSTSCCEATWWYISYWPSGKTAYLKPKNGSYSAFNQTMQTYASAHCIDSLYSFMQINSLEIEFTSDSLMLDTKTKRNKRLILIQKE